MAKNAALPDVQQPATVTEPQAGAPPQSANMSIDQAVATAYAHWNAGQVNQAEILCQKVLAVWPENSEALHLLGLMSLNWGNLDLAIDYLRRACRAPRAPAIYFSNLAEMCRRKGLLEEGEMAARRAVTLEPDMVGAWNNLGILLQEANKYDESLRCLERVVALKPDYAEAQNNLGNTLKKLGRLDQAKQAYLRALTLAPNYPEGHSNFSNLLKDLGEVDAAVAEARKAVELNPRLADAYINAAAAESVRNNHEEALRWLNALLAFAPTHGLALAAKSGSLHKLEVLDQSLEAARQAVLSLPDNGDAYNALGQALQALGYYDEALAAFEKSTNLMATVPEQALINKGLLLMEINKKAEAREAFDAAIKRNPRSASAYFNAADAKSYKAEDPEIAQMENLLQTNQVQNFNDRMALHFALGKAWMDAGNIERAFDYLDKGNKLKRSTIAYDADATTKWLEQIAGTFTPALFKKFKGAGFATERPIFVLGMPRSGTTLVEQILAAHPDVMGAGELSTIRRLAMPMRMADGRAVAYPEGVPSLTAQDITQFGQSYIAETEKYARGNKLVVDKMPANFLYAGLIAMSMPGARIVHCRRDPVDTCLSCYTKLFSAEQNFSYDLEELGKFHNAYKNLMNHWRGLLPPERFIEIDYEAVVADLESEARCLIAFAGLPWNDACLEFYQSNRPIRTASVNQVRQPIYKSSVGRWKKYAPHLKPLLKALNIPMPPAKK